MAGEEDQQSRLVEAKRDRNLPNRVEREGLGYSRPEVGNLHCQCVGDCGHSPGSMLSPHPRLAAGLHFPASLPSLPSCRAWLCDYIRASGKGAGVTWANSRPGP